MPPEEGQSYHAKHPPIRAEAVGRPKVLGGKKVDGHGGDQHRSTQEVCKGEEDERPELWTSKGSEVPSSPQQAEPPSLLCPSQHGFCPGRLSWCLKQGFSTCSGLFPQPGSAQAKAALQILARGGGVLRGQGSNVAPAEP